MHIPNTVLFFRVVSRYVLNYAHFLLSNNNYTTNHALNLSDSELVLNVWDLISKCICMSCQYFLAFHLLCDVDLAMAKVFIFFVCFLHAHFSFFFFFIRNWLKKTLKHCSEKKRNQMHHFVVASHKHIIHWNESTESRCEPKRIEHIWYFGFQNR